MATKYILLLAFFLKTKGAWALHHTVLNCCTPCNCTMLSENLHFCNACSTPDNIHELFL